VRENFRSQVFIGEHQEGCKREIAQKMRGEIGTMYGRWDQRHGAGGLTMVRALPVIVAT
jgi:hypothetical protein